MSIIDTKKKKKKPADKAVLSADAMSIIDKKDTALYPLCCNGFRLSD